MNFRIIEGDTTDWELYESFKDLYFNNLELTLHDIQDRLNLTYSQLNKFRRHTIQETGKQRTRTNGTSIQDTDKITTGLFWEKYPEFKTLYLNNDYNSLKIRKLLGLSRYAYDQLQRKVTKETGYIKRNQWGMDKK